MSTDPPSSSPAAPSRSTAEAGPPGSPTAPPFDLGPGLRFAQFVLGRYATAIQRSLAGNHALQRVREDSTASFSLDLAADGTATACRGWRYYMTNDGPRVHTENRLHEQAGFRGHFVERGDTIDVELTRDDSVCAAVGEYTLVPPRATTITLRCARAVPDGHPSLTAPVLVCRWMGPPSGELDAHVVESLGAPGVMILGSGAGLRIKLEGTPPRLTGTRPTSVTITVPTAPLPEDAWATPF